LGYAQVFYLLVKALNGAAVFLTGVLVTMANDPEYGASAVRAMPFLAGILLVLGVGGYVIARPRDSWRSAA
jgi:hypothetical protein